MALIWDKFNLVSVLPSLLLLAGLIYGILQIFQFRKPLTFERTFDVFSTLLILSTTLGYLWFVYRYFAQTNLVIKATYVIQLFIALLFLSAGLMEAIRKKSPLAYHVILILLALVFIHNLPAMFTRYNTLLGFK